MLLGYRPETGEIEFVFTDDSYLKKQFPNNTAKIDNFWKYQHGLKEHFIDAKDFTDSVNYKNYKIVNNKIIKKTQSEIELMSVLSPSPKIKTANFKETNLNNNSIDAIQKQIDILQTQLNKLKGGKI